jgi:hypothetical protein
MINLIQLKNKINFSEKKQWIFVPLVGKVDRLKTLTG